MSSSIEELCIKCNKNITTEDKTALQCDFCDRWLHKICLDKQYNYNKEKKRYLWFCSVKCRQEIGSDADIFEINKEQLTLDHVMNGMAQLCRSISKIKEKIKTESKFNEKTKRICQQNKNMQQQITHLQQEIGDIKQKKINHKAIFHGVPIGNEDKTKSESVTETIRYYLDRNNINANLESVKKCYRIKTKNNHSTPPIVMEFANPEEKNKFIKNMKVEKEKRKSNTTIPKFSVVELLVEEKRQLLSETWEFLQNYKFKWTKNGQIYIKKAEKLKTIKISTSRDIVQHMGNQLKEATQL